SDINDLDVKDKRGLYHEGVKRTILLAGAASLITGCAREAPPPRSAPLAQDLAAWVAEGDPAREPRRLAAAPARIADDGPEARYATRRIAPPAEVIPRPKRQGRVD